MTCFCYYLQVFFFIKYEYNIHLCNVAIALCLENQNLEINSIIFSREKYNHAHITQLNNIHNILECE